jgi:hypothetical protein
VGLHFAKKRQQNKCMMGWVCIFCKKAKMKPQMQEPRLKRQKGYETYYGTKMRLQEVEEDGIHMWWSHSKSKNTKWIVTCLCFHKNCTHKWTPPYVGIVEQWVAFIKKEKKGGKKKQTPSAQGVYIDSLPAFPFLPSKC